MSLVLLFVGIPLVGTTVQVRRNLDVLCVCWWWLVL